MHAFLNKLWEKHRIVIFYVVLILFGWFLGGILKDATAAGTRTMNEPAIQMMVMSAFALFVILAAIPFVPGAEVGFTLLLIFGGQAAPLVYFGMVGSLTIAYVIARLVPSSVLGLTLRWFKLEKAADLILELDAKRPEERLDMLSNIAPRGMGQNLFRYRFFLLAIALNTPGNSLLGGGGGLAFVAGASRLFGFLPFLVTITLAVAPVPLFFFLS